MVKHDLCTHVYLYKISILNIFVNENNTYLILKLKKLIFIHSIKILVTEYKINFKTLYLQIKLNMVHKNFK